MARKQVKLTKQRTRQHVIASLSVNHVERFVYERGCSAERVENDYGYDLIVWTYDPEGYIEPGFILFQLKATDHIKKVGRDSAVSFAVSIQDYRLWMAEGYPVVLVIYDAIAARAYWLYFQHHFVADGTRVPAPGATTVTVRIPIGNELSGATIDHMRAEKATFMAQFARVTHHE